MGSQRKNNNVHNYLPFLALGLIISCLGFARAATTLPKPVRLQWQYYKRNTTCDDAEAYVRHQVQLFWRTARNGKTILPKLLKLLYSDCFVTVSDHYFQYIDHTIFMMVIFFFSLIPFPLITWILICVILICYVVL